MIPPDVGVMPRIPLPCWVEELPQHAESVIGPAITPEIPLYAMADETLMVSLEQGQLELAPSLGKPEQCHHVSEVFRAEVHVPCLPVDEPDRLGGRIARIQDVA